MKTNALALAAAVAVSWVSAAGACEVAAVSPDGRNEIRLYDEPAVAYAVFRDGVAAVARSEIGMMFDGRCLVAGAKIASADRGKIEGVAKCALYKKSEIPLDANETVADFGDFSIRLVARNDGVAYRFETRAGGRVKVDAERASVTIPDAEAKVWSCFTDRIGCEETVPETYKAGEIDWRGRVAYLPFVYSAGGKCVAVVESDVHGYPVWNLAAGENAPGSTGVSLASKFAKSGYGDDSVLAETDGTRTFPWRAFVLADKPSELCENDLVWALATPAAEGDWSWIKPGKVAWDWWNDFNFGDGEEGHNTAGYRHYVDFAAANGIEYVILDDGWRGDTIWEYNPDVDVPGIIEYAKERGVGIILWMHWDFVRGQEQKIAEHYSKAGAKGFKDDFMDRGDDLVADFLEKFAAECAKCKMLVDYHGVYRPVGLNRTWPNILNYEGIHGLEQMKWFGGYDFMANDVRQFFLRFTAGQADYTPGAMKNYPIGRYGGNWHVPGSIGTRCRQMALMSLYFAPLQMMCDTPMHYEAESECASYMAKIPVVWEKTVALGGCPDTMAAVARKAAGDVWYAAGITNADARDFAFKTCFLGGGEWTAEIFRDASDCDEAPQKYVHETVKIDAGAEMSFHMAKGGGFTVRFSK